MLMKKLTLHYSDLLDSTSLTNLINSIEPDEIYNLAAQSHVAVSFKTLTLLKQALLTSCFIGSYKEFK